VEGRLFRRHPGDVAAAVSFKEDGNPSDLEMEAYAVHVPADDLASNYVRGPERRMPRKGHLGAGSEDPHVVPVVTGGVRQDERGLGEPHFLRDSLHVLARQSLGVEDHGELVPGVLLLGEYIDNVECQASHGDSPVRFSSFLMIRPRRAIPSSILSSSAFEKFNRILCAPPPSTKKGVPGTKTTLS